MCDSREEWACQSGVKSSAGTGTAGGCGAWANPAKVCQTCPLRMTGQQATLYPRYIQSKFGWEGSQSSSSFCPE